MEKCTKPLIQKKMIENRIKKQENAHKKTLTNVESTKVLQKMKMNKFTMNTIKNFPQKIKSIKEIVAWIPQAKTNKTKSMIISLKENPLQSRDSITNNNWQKKSGLTVTSWETELIPMWMIFRISILILKLKISNWFILAWI